MNALRSSAARAQAQRIWDDLEIDGGVYFIRFGSDGPIKIGYATDTVSRLHSLQTGSPVQLHLIGHVVGTIKDERKLHARFAHLRIRGEWFEPAADLLAHIDEVLRAPVRVAS